MSWNVRVGAVLRVVRNCVNYGEGVTIIFVMLTIHWITGRRICVDRIIYFKKDKLTNIYIKSFKFKPCEHL